MNRYIFLLSITCMIGYTSATAQYNEIGLFIGASQSLTDIGGNSGEGTLFLKDINLQATRAGGSVYFKQNFNSHIGIKYNAGYTNIVGNDKYAPNSSASSFRNARGLSFSTHIAEVNALVEYNFLNYITGDVSRMATRWTPYVSAGVGGIFFIPTTNLGGKWVRLRPLGTEGQGLSGYSKKYLPVQPILLGGGGIKYSPVDRLSVGIELLYRYTFTDYLDDVSKNYPLKADLVAAYGTEKADYIWAVSNPSNASGEINPSTAEGMQRGNPKNKDQYFTLGITLGYKLGRSGRTRCPKF